MGAVALLVALINAFVQRFYIRDSFDITAVEVTVTAIFDPKNQ